MAEIVKKLAAKSQTTLTDLATTKSRIGYTPLLLARVNTRCQGDAFPILIDLSSGIKNCFVIGQLFGYYRPVLRHCIETIKSQSLKLYVK